MLFRSKRFGLGDQVGITSRTGARHQVDADSRSRRAVVRRGELVDDRGHVCGRVLGNLGVLDGLGRDEYLHLHSHVVTPKVGRYSERIALSPNSSHQIPKYKCLRPQQQE